MSGDVIQYVPFSSFVDPAFWHTITRVKLDVDRLEENEREIIGHYCYRDDLPAMLEVDGTAFNRDAQSPPLYAKITGILINKNTIESFKGVDKTELLNAMGRKQWKDVQSKDWIHSPNKLLKFLLLVFLDLKKYHYYYWFAFPVPSKPAVYMKSSKLIRELFTEEQIKSMNDLFKLFDETQKSFFIIESTYDDIKLKPLASLLQENIEENVKKNGTYFAFLDSSNGSNPGWPLRSFLAVLIELCPSIAGNDLQVIGVRCKMNGDVTPSMCFTIAIPENLTKTEDYGWVGWERNDQGKFTPKLANMSASMDPVRLAEDSADLNLKLMKWRLAPTIDLDAMKQTKCLLLGAGTLGCHVARNLLAWGFRNITFLDNGKVSYSNPVRQVLFTHKDCKNGNMKAIAAANQLKKILPNINANSIVCHIPMPGHPVGDSMRKETLDNIDKLTSAISDHDFVFLLLDTREARWLPTLLAAHYNKSVINAALGFDSYLVMRHGCQGEECSPAVDTEYVGGDQLGCYFCSDVTAPGNSMKDRTLDQQCTVTRPGVSAIAGALAVEMTVSILQHRLGIKAPAAYNLSKSMEKGLQPAVESVLGPIPHSVRGFLFSHQVVLPTCVKFKHCVACSDHILAQYRSNSTEFLLKVFGDASYLETVTGLTELHLAAEMLDVMALSDEEEEITT